MTTSIKVVERVVQEAMGEKESVRVARMKKERVLREAGREKAKVFLASLTPEQLRLRATMQKAVHDQLDKALPYLEEAYRIVVEAGFEDAYEMDRMEHLENQDERDRIALSRNVLQAYWSVLGRYDT